MKNQKTIQQEVNSATKKFLLVLLALILFYLSWVFPVKKESLFLNSSEITSIKPFAGIATIDEIEVSGHFTEFWVGKNRDQKIEIIKKTNFWGAERYGRAK